MINAITSALSGLNAAAKQIEQSAASIASAPDTGRVIKDIVEIKQAEIAYKANIEVLNATNEMTEEFLNNFDKTV